MKRVAHRHTAGAAGPRSPTPLPSHPGLFPLSSVVSKHAVLCLREQGRGPQAWFVLLGLLGTCSAASFESLGRKCSGDDQVLHIWQGT